MSAKERFIQTLSTYRIETEKPYYFVELAPIINIKAQIRCESGRKPLDAIFHISGRMRFPSDAAGKRW